MSDDGDLRERLARLAADVRPDVESRLAGTVHLAHRRRRRRWLALGAVNAAVVALVVSLLVVRLGGDDKDTVSEPPQPRITGMWRTALRSSDPTVAGEGMNGPWSIAFNASGALDVSVPPGFRGPRSGYSFSVLGDVMTTDLLGEDVCTTKPPGMYRYTVLDRELTFDVVQDACPARIALLTAAPWTP